MGTIPACTDGRATEDESGVLDAGLDAGVLGAGVLMGGAVTVRVTVTVG
ncbi:hypothetical protein ACIA58_19875 [Kribbella sp. NPDC051586]